MKKFLERCKQFKLDRLSTLKRMELLMTTLADKINDIDTKTAALQAAVAALPTTTGGTVDLTATDAKIDAVQTTVTAIQAELTPTPAA